MRKLNAKKILILALVCPLAASRSKAVTPQVTVQATGITLLGTNAPISLTCTLLDPGHTGTLRISGGGTLVNFRASTVTPGNTAQVGPIWGNDTVTNGLGITNSTYYLCQVFVQNSGGFLSTTPAFQQFYSFTGSATYDLVSATPILPNSFNTPTGVSIPGTLSVAGQITSTVSTGTAPFSIASTTVVPNLDAQLLNGQSAPASAIVGISDAQALTNKTFDISANTLKSSSNTAGHYPRNNGTQYADNTIQAADMPVFVASGASHAPGAVPDPGSSAGTTRFLREDATWQTVSGGAATACTNFSPVTVNNTVAATNLLSCTVNANTLAQGSVLEVNIQGIESYAGAPGTITVTVNLGAGTSCASTFSVVVANNQPWNFVAHLGILTAGSGGTANWSCDSFSPGSFGFGANGTVGAPTIAINTTIANTLLVTETMSAANAGNFMTGQILKAVIF
jgi:hypothetical protein